MNENNENQAQQANPYGQPGPSYLQSPYYYPAAYPVRQFQQQQTPGTQGMLPLQQSFIENILRLNRGKLATVYMTFEGNNQRTFTGIIEAAGRDHIILSEEGTERRVLLLMVYLDYVTFSEEIAYDYPYDSSGQLSSYQSRS